MGIFIKIGILHTLKFHLHTLTCHFWLNLCLAPNRWQVIIWTNADPIHWRIYAVLGGDQLICLSMQYHSLVYIYREKVHIKDSLSRKKNTCLSYLVNTMANDDLVQGAKASAGIMLMQLAWNIMLLGWEGLNYITDYSLARCHSIYIYSTNVNMTNKSRPGWYWEETSLLQGHVLTHCGLVTPYGNINQHWLR